MPNSPHRRNKEFERSGATWPDDEVIFIIEEAKRFSSYEMSLRLKRSVGSILAKRNAIYEMARTSPRELAESLPQIMAYLHPGWMADFYPELMIDFYPRFMAYHKPEMLFEKCPDLIADIRPEWVANHHPSWMAKHRVMWAAKNDPRLIDIFGLPDSLKALDIVVGEE